MLNRRLLRSKVVQALYASKIATEANRLLAIDQITEAYQPDLNSMLPQNRPRLEGLKRLSLLTLDELIKTGQPAQDDEVPVDVVRNASRAYEEYRKRNQQDGRVILNRVLKETEAIYDEFLLILQLMVELAHQAKLDREREFQNPDDTHPKASGLDDNTVIQQLTASEAFELQVIRAGTSWSNEMTLVRKTYREALRTDPLYIAYCSQATHTREEDQKMAQHVLRQIILKHEIPLGFLQQNDLYWDDHAELVRSLAIKTLRTADSGKIQLAELTDDWEEDKFFIEELYRKAIENDVKYEGYLLEQLKNWDPERIALVDMIIMKAAITEMIHFPGIPVKVTINEFIEIAKRYSTLKSGKFVNGNLDRLAEKLKENGVIRKSGRGLIDNK